MAARRLPSRTTYTRRQTADLLNISERTVIRWQGKTLHPHRDPNDPTGRLWVYDRTEVDNLVRRRRREGNDARAVPVEQITPLPEERPSEPVLPGPVAARVYAMLREGRSIDEIVEAVMVAPEAIIHLAKLREIFEAERARKGRPAKSRTEPGDDVELAKWAKQLDDEQQRWQREHDDGDDGPPSSGRAA